MRIGLVSMPWLVHYYPSTAIASLLAYLKENANFVTVHDIQAHCQLWTRIQKDYEAIAEVPWLGELLYSRFLYPDIAEENFQRAINQCLSRHAEQAGRSFPSKQSKLLTENWVDRIAPAMTEHLTAVADQLVDYDVLGLTTSSYQLFSSIALAAGLKKANPRMKVILGGCGTALAAERWIRHYSDIDFVIVGQGERRLLALLRQLESHGQLQMAIDGVVGRDTARNGKAGTLFSDGDSIEDFPIPDYTEFASFAESNGIFWSIPIESSRGCARDSRVFTQDDLRSCYFCGIAQPPTQYHPRNPDDVAKEIEQQMLRYSNPRLHFCDSHIDNPMGLALAKRLKEHRRNYKFTMDVRATASDTMLAEMVEVGCVAIQVGIEGLSTSYLQRINKGTTTIQNLRCMRSLYELGIVSESNLLIGFPQTPQSEIDETCRNIEHAATCYEPLRLSPFTLSAFSPAYCHPERFGISRIRHAEPLQLVFPASLGSDIFVPWFDFEVADQSADWTPLVEACKKWTQLHKELRDECSTVERARPLYYLDGRSFLEIIDRRTGFRTITLEPLWRDLYLFCMRIRSREEIMHEYSDRASTETIFDEVIGGLLAEKLLFAENNHYLSLAVASRPDIAIQRIREQAN